MRKKYMIVLVILIVATMAIYGCSKSDPVESISEEDMIELTLEELSQYNGQDGNPAYIAVDGVIYDVSGVSRWKNGKHNGFEAGNDLTDAIKNISPHGVSKLKSVPAIGTIIEE